MNIENTSVCESEIVSLMFIDIAQYTKTTSALDRHKINKLHDRFDKICNKFTSQYKGKIIKKVGDEFLIIFKSPTNAVICAKRLQNAFERANGKVRVEYRFKTRIAIHNGEVIYRENDIYGEAVNITSRIEEITKPGEIYISGTVYLSMNRNEFSCFEIGVFKFKGLDYSIKIYGVKLDSINFFDKIFSKIFDLFKI